MMKKKLLLIATAAALVLALAIPALALAQSQGTATATNPAVRDSLAIVAPRAAAIGAPVQMTVFRASDQTAVAGAGVWSVAGDNITVLKDEISNLKGEPADELQAAALQALDAHATFLGYTDQSGKIFHAFNDNGRYLLATFKSGFLPGFRPIAIGRVILPSLTIEAPKTTVVDDKVDVTVVQKGTEEGVKDVDIWAMTPAQARALKAQISILRQSDNSTLISSTIENAIRSEGSSFLGTTNGAGKLEPQPAFPVAGGYLLVALGQGYRPALKGIFISKPAPVPNHNPKSPYTSG